MGAATQGLLELADRQMCAPCAGRVRLSVWCSSGRCVLQLLVGPIGLEIEERGVDESETLGPVRTVG